MSNWNEDPNSFFAITLTVLRGLVSVSLSLPFIFFHPYCHSSQKHASITNIRSGRDSCNSGNVHPEGLVNTKGWGEC